MSSVPRKIDQARLNHDLGIIPPDSPVKRSNPTKRTRTSSKAEALLDAAVLGGLMSAWRREEGEPIEKGDYLAFGEAETMRAFENPERIRQVEVLFQPAIPVEEARERGLRYFPKDAKHLKTYIARAGQTVEVYRSQQLAKAFGRTSHVKSFLLFGEAKPGTFILIVKRGSSETGRAMLSLGDNP